MVMNALRLACLLLTGAGLISISRATGAEPAKPPDSTRIAALIGDLDSDAFATREKATQELLRLGESALPAVQTALKLTRSMEVRTRCEHLVHDISIWGGPHHDICLSDILDQVKVANRSADPATACKDGKLEKLLQQCMRPLTASAGRKDDKLPVAFKDVRYQAYDPQDRSASNIDSALVIMKRGKITFAQHCIILADEQVEISQPRDCIIIARIAAKVHISKNCVIVAGYHLDANIDEGSVLLSGSQIRLGIVKEAICAAGQPSRMGIMEQNTFVNWPQFDRERQRARAPNRYVELPELKLSNPATKNPLSDRMRLTQAFAEREGLALFRLANGKGEYVARYGQPINDPDGKPIAELKGWTLCFADYGFAVFSDGENFASLTCTER